MADFKDFLKAHLNVAWLRPESAFWDAIASTVLSRFQFLGPALDLGCGNGLFSFITAGGRFSADYDWYHNVNTRGFRKNRDIYDAYKQTPLERCLRERPGYDFAAGLDHKRNLLRQASGLSFYHKLIYSDAAKSLPFPEENFQTVFSNILYWLPRLEKSLCQIYRVLKKSGKAFLCLPDACFYQLCPSYQWREKKSSLLRLLNRGRSETLHWTVTAAGFRRVARACGFQVVYHQPYLAPLTLQVWDIGLRPFSPYLIDMANALPPKKRQQIKKAWIQTAYDLLLPLWERERKNKRQWGFHFFIIEKQP